MTVPSFPLLPAPPAGLECGAVTGTVTVEEAAFASPIFLWWFVSFSPSPHRSRSSLPPASDVIVSSFPFLTSRVGAEVPGVSPSLCRSAGRFPQTRLRGAPHAASPSCPRFWLRGPQRRHARPLTPAGQSLSGWGPWAGHVCCHLVREMRPHRAFRADELADRCPALRAGEQGPGAWHGTSGTSSRGDGHMGLLTWDRGALGGFGVPEGAEAGGGAPSVTAGTPKEAGEGKGIPLPVHTRRCLPGSRQPGARGTVRDIPVSCTDRLLLR